MCPEVCVWQQENQVLRLEEVTSPAARISFGSKQGHINVSCGKKVWYLVEGG
jgi:hypothetical protein